MKQKWMAINRTLTRISGYLLCFVMLLVNVEIISRLVFNTPIIGLHDIVTVMIPIFVFLPMAYTEIVDHHIRVEVVTTHFSKTGKNMADLFAYLCGFCLLIIFAWQNWEYAMNSWGTDEYYPGILRIRVYPAKFAIALGSTLFAVQFLINAIVATGNVLKNDSPAQLGRPDGQPEH